MFSLFMSSTTMSRHQVSPEDSTEKEGGKKRTGKVESGFRDHRTRNVPIETNCDKMTAAV